MERRYSTLAHPGAAIDKLLGDLERELMEILWQRGEGSVRDVLLSLNRSRSPDRQLAYTTVMTVMARLAEKGLLSRHRVGKAHEYEVAESREAFLARSSHDIARRMVEDFGDAAIASFIDVLEGVAPDRLEKLRQRAQGRDQA